MNLNPGETPEAAKLEGSCLVPLRVPCVVYDANFLEPGLAEEYYDKLLKTIPWETSAKINRWVYLCQDRGAELDSTYQYRDAPTLKENETPDFTELVRLIAQRAQQWYQNQAENHLRKETNEDIHTENDTSVQFNVCLLNYYENGLQRIGWHADREEMGRTTPVLSISLGATRSFFLRAKVDGGVDRATIPLTSGSILCMTPPCQEIYVHAIPKEPNIVTGRINLTFRCKNSNDPTMGERLHERRNNWMPHMLVEEPPGEEDCAHVASSEAQVGHGPSGWSASSSLHGKNLPQNYLNHPNDDSLSVFGDNVASGHDVTAIQYIVKTNLGAECYCAAEIHEYLCHDDASQSSRGWHVMARPFGIDGYVAIWVPSTGTSDPTIAEWSDANRSSAFEAKLLRLRSAHHVMQYHAHFNLSDCCPVQNCDDENVISPVDGETIYRYCKDCLVNGTLSISTMVSFTADHVGSFRVSCDRIGTAHAFRGPEIEREIGGALSEYYPYCRPNMEDYDVHIRADVVGTFIVIGTQMNVHDLSKDRHFLRYRNAVTLKTNLAYAMVRCANIHPGARIADPFCGSGTLLLEALDMYDRKLSCLGMDVSKRSVEGSRKNAAAEQCGTDLCEFVCADARSLRRHLADDSVDAIITNLPWGVMTGHKNVSDLQTMYEIFLRNSWYALKARARIVMFVLRGLQLTRIIRKLSGRYRLLSVNVIRTANNLPCIIVVEKLANDEIRDSIKKQLMHLNKFVTVSPEMYRAIHTETIDES